MLILYNRCVLSYIHPIYSTEEEVLLPQDEEQHVTPEEVLKVLQTCYDPCCKERAVSVVELGLIQNVKVAENGRDVHVELLLTSGWCPFSAHLLGMIDQTLHGIEGIGEVDTEIVWNTVWTPERMSASAKEKTYAANGTVTAVATTSS